MFSSTIPHFPSYKGENAPGIVVAEGTHELIAYLDYVDSLYSIRISEDGTASQRGADDDWYVDYTFSVVCSAPVTCLEPAYGIVQATDENVFDVNTYRDGKFKNRFGKIIRKHDLVSFVGDEGDKVTLVITSPTPENLVVSKILCNPKMSENTARSSW